MGYIKKISRFIPGWIFRTTRKAFEVPGKDSIHEIWITQRNQEDAHFAWKSE